jgi:hypothetical protein
MAIHQSQQYDRLEAALRDGLRRLAGEDCEALREALEPGCEPATSLLQEVADYMYALSALGEQEQRACLDILRSFQTYARMKGVH